MKVCGACSILGTRFFQNTLVYLIKIMSVQDPIYLGHYLHYNKTNKQTVIRDILLDTPIIYRSKDTYILLDTPIIHRSKDTYILFKPH